MNNHLITAVLSLLVLALGVSAQVRKPSTPAGPFVVKNKQQVSDIQNALKQKSGNANEDIVAAAGMQTRVAIFQDKNRVNDLNEVHDGSDDIYYVLECTSTLMLG